MNYANLVQAIAQQQISTSSTMKTRSPDLENKISRMMDASDSPEIRKLWATQVSTNEQSRFAVLLSSGHVKCVNHVIWLPKLNGPFQSYEVPQQFRETQQFRESCMQHPSSRDWSKYIERQHFLTSLSNTVHHFPTNSNIKYQMTPTKEFRPSSTPVQNTRTHATMNLHIPMARQTVIVSSTNTRTSTTKLSQTEPSSWLCATQVAPTYQGKLVSPTYEPTNRAIVEQTPTNAQVRHQDSQSTQGTRTKCQDPMCRKAIRKCQDCRKHT